MMVSTTYLHVQHLAAQLDPHDQARLLEYLSSRMTAMVSLLSSVPSPAPSRQTTTWQEFFRMGDALMKTDCPDAPTLTATLLEMRR